MNTKTMEGLVGANMNMELINTPFRVYKEAKRRGDTATMERAMGYVCDFKDKAYEYKAEADEGMEEDAKAAREKAEIERENAIQKRREEREKFKEKIEENRKENKETDTVTVSEEGKLLLKESNVTNNNLENIDNTSLDKEAAYKKQAVYTKTGEIIQPKQTQNISVSI